MERKYQHLFFDLDHTLWDFESNSRLTLEELYEKYELKQKGILDFEEFNRHYIIYNERLWEKYRNGQMKVEELRWKRMWLTLLEFKIADEELSREMGMVFLERLPTRNILFPHTREILDYLVNKNYHLHLITNGFERTQHSKLQNARLESYFETVITSETSNSLKPNKEIFDFALMKTRARKVESIMLGDSIEVDIAGAMNAGIDQVYINHTGIEPQIKPTYTVYSLKELENIF